MVIEHMGYRFKVEIERDEDMREPWKEHDGHGIVSEWITRNKALMERVLSEDHGSGSLRYYDVEATIQKAIREEWGTQDGQCAGESKRSYAARAVEEDFLRMRDWCDDRWWWVGVVVTLLDTDGESTGENASVWGVESDAGEEYLAELARQNAEEIIARIGGADVLTRRVRA